MERRIRNFILSTIVASIVAALAAPEVVAQRRGRFQRNQTPVGVPVNSPLLREPTNPGEYLDAIVFLVDVGRPELARSYLERLLDQDLDPETLFALREAQGAAKLFRLTRVKELEPLAMEFYSQTGEATLARSRDPQRIVRMIQLLGASVEERVWAISELRKAGNVAVPHLLHSIQSPKGAADRSGAIRALVHLGKEAVPALLGALQTDDLALKAVVIATLRRIGDPRAAPFLYSLAAGATPDDPQAIWAREALEELTGQQIDSPQTASDLLRQLADRYYRASATLSPSSEQTSVELWTWNQTEQVPVPREISQREAAYDLGLQFVRQALMLDPDNPQGQTLLLSLMLESEASRVGFDRPLPQGPGTSHDLALRRGTELVAAVLRRALDDRRTRVALAATRLLADLNAENQLYAEGWRPGLLLETVEYPDRRVQLAAAKAVLDLEPTGPFAGSDRILSVLARAVGIEDRPKVLVADVHTARGRQTASLFAQLGYATDLASTGREAFTLAAESAGFDLVCLDPMILRFDLSQTIANLRSDSRTAGVPILIVGPQRWGSAMEHFQRRHADVKFIIRPTDAHGLQVQLDPFLAGKESKFLLAGERAALRDFAYDWLLRMANGELPQFDPLRAEKALERALSNPSLAPRAAKDLGLTSSLRVPRTPGLPTRHAHAGQHPIPSLAQAHPLRLGQESGEARR